MAGNIIDNAPFSRLPRGLLDFLGVKAFGRYPNTMDARVMPTMDLLQWIGEMNAEIFLLSNVGGLVTGSPGIVYWTTEPAQFITGGISAVPNDEAWIVWAMTARANYTTAGDLLNFGLCFLPTGNLGAVRTPPQVQLGATSGNAGAAAANATGTYTVTLSLPIFLPPGTQFAIQAFNITKAVANNYNGAMTVSRFKV